MAWDDEAALWVTLNQSGDGGWVGAHVGVGERTDPAVRRRAQKAATEQDAALGMPDGDVVPRVSGAGIEKLDRAEPYRLFLQAAHRRGDRMAISACEADAVGMGVHRNIGGAHSLDAA